MNQDQSSKEDWCGRLWNGMDLLKDVTKTSMSSLLDLKGIFMPSLIQSSSLIGYVNILFLYYLL